jgi:hypothetical protein
MDEAAISMLNDPIALSRTLKDQFDKAVTDNHQKFTAQITEESQYRLDVDESYNNNADQSQGSGVLWPSQQAEQAN